MQFHPMAEAYPIMSDDEFNGLVEDIKKNGLKIPIVVYEDKILDGRNRFKACGKVGVTPKFEDFKGESALSFVVSMNSHRRHLTASQKATVASELEPFFAEEAKKRYAETVGRPTKSEGKFPQKSERIPQARDQAAIAVGGVDGTYVSRAKAIKKDNPEMFERVKSGQVTISQAVRESKRDAYREKVRRASITKQDAPEGPFDLVLADPPWKYDFSETDGRKVENQYNTQTVDEICKHPPTTSADCVLLLWATAPKLPEAMRVMDAWGFAYKTNAIWDKQKIGMGYWFRGQHELLLVGTRGKVSPPNETARVSSVFSEERRKHSEKPECVYAWIDRAFPGLSKLEMYCRNKRPGWAVQGNEV